MLLVEVDGLDGGVAAQVDAVATVAPAQRRGAACGSRPTTPNGRCSGRGGSRRSARSPGSHPTTTSTTRSCRARRLVEVLRRVYEIADEHELIMMNVFHAGDGNLHPLIVFDRREPGIWERVYDAGNEILTTCIAAGGVLTGEHGVGYREARPHVAAVLSRRPRRGGRPARRVRSRRRREPAEGVAPREPVRRVATGTRRRVDIVDFEATPVEALAAPVAGAIGRPVGARTQWEDGRSAARGRGVEVGAPAGIVRYEPDDLTVTVGAGTPFATSMPRWPSTVRSARSIRARHRRDYRRGRSRAVCPGIRRLRHGPLRDHVLEVRFVTADGRLVKGGGPTVKNVTGYDLPRLFVGSFGTLGVLVQVTLRCRPRAARLAMVLVPTSRDRVPRRGAIVGRTTAQSPARRRRRRRRRSVGRGSRMERPARVARRRRIGAASRSPPACDLAIAPARRGGECVGARELGVGTVHVAADDSRRRSRAPDAVAHAHDGWMLREAGRPPTTDGFGTALPERGLMRRVKDAFDPDRQASLTTGVS